MSDNRSLIILGLSFDYHNAAAALIKDGEIIAATGEERFSRRKNFQKMNYDTCEKSIKK